MSRSLNSLTEPKSAMGTLPEPENTARVGARAWVVWGLAAAYFFCDYLARVSPSVMSYELQISFGVTTFGLGLLSSFFYYPYIAMQLPVGLLIDRYSVRWLLMAMSLMTALGCTLFGLSEGLFGAAVGRAFIGFSAAFAFVSALRLASVWFPPSQLGLLAGLTQALGMWGAAFGEAPVSLVNDWVGWRHTMILMGALFVMLACLIAGLVRDHPDQDNAESSETDAATSSQLSVIRSLVVVLRNKQSWWNALYAGLLFAPTAVIAEFWGPTYLQFGRGLSAHAAAFANGLIFIGWGIGGPLVGWLSDRMQLRLPAMRWSPLCGLVLMVILITVPGLTTTQINLIFFLFGLTNVGVAVAYAVSTEINPANTVGASIAFANMASILVGAVLQPIFGWAMEWSTGQAIEDITHLTAQDFELPIWLLPICLIIALLTTCFIKETRCQKSH